MSQDKSKLGSKKSWFVSAFGEFNSSSNLEGLSNKRSNSQSKAGAVQQSGGIPWVDKYSPKSIRELAVHKKKVESVNDWLLNAVVKEGATFALLKGPTGSGKSTTIKVAAQDMGIDCKEWITPANVNSYYEDFEGNRSYENYRSDSELLKNFVIRASRYPSVFSERPGKSVVIVEDWPASVVRDPSLWHTILLEFAELGKCPLVMVVGEENLVSKLVPDQLARQLKVEIINFNPLATTLLTKILSDISAKEAPRSFPTKDVIENICQSSCGDLRSAINSLQFALLQGFSKDSVKSFQGKLQNSPENKRKKILKSAKAKQDDSNNLANIGGRDSPDDFFHMISKALYAKRNDNGQLKTCPEDIVEKVTDRAEFFTEFLQENYLDFMPDIQSASKCAHSLQCASILLQGSFDKPSLASMGLSVTMRGIMSSKRSATRQSSFRAHRRPKYYDASKFNKLNLEAQRVFPFHKTSSRAFLTEMLPYTTIISPDDLTNDQCEVLSKVPLEGCFWRRPSIPTTQIVENGLNGTYDLDKIEEVDSD